ncbi:type I polyketide synthase, partial [Streptomyces solincola]
MSFAQVNRDTDATATTGTATTPAAVAGLLRELLAGLLGAAPDTVPADLPLRELGLESAQLLQLAAEVATRLDRPVPTWALWQYPTVAQLAAYLAGEEPPAGAAAQPARPRAASADEPVAVVGIGCRLPGGIETPDALWQGLLAGIDAIREVPADRWNAQEWLDPDPRAPGRTNSRWGGFLDDVAGFDAELFRISPAEARHMDPQQRIALETAWAALEDARIAHHDLAGSRTGVFLGTMAQEYHLATGADPDAIGAHSATGWDNSIIPARIAYTLGLHGPALAVATACSSSLTAVHLAAQSLRGGESDLALAGGVNVLLHPHTSVAMTKFGGLNPDGQCRAFDADAGGYVRAEGCGVVVLRRLSDALAAGDRIYAVVRGSAVNNDGASNGLTAPNPRAQSAVVRAAWQAAGVAPRDVSYVEAHGTGTPLGDPVEAEGLAAVFAEDRDEPLHIGSVKTNFGHLEPAAGVLGLIKTTLALHHGELPASLHFDTPNPHIDFAAAKLSVVAERRPWPGEGRRYAGVSGFGFGGANAHVALEEAPFRRRLLVPLGAADRAGLREAADALLERARSGQSWYAPGLLGSGSAAHRAVAAVSHPDHLPAALAQALAEAEAEAEAEAGAGAGAAPVPGGDRPELVFLFSGHGSQWLGMGRDLLAEPAFRAAIEECDRAVRDVTGWSVLDELLAHPAASSRLERTEVVQPVLFSVQVALARTLASWGVRPAAVAGQSIGEVAAAVTAGALTTAEGARVICALAQCADRISGRGAMTVADLDPAAAHRLIAETGGDIAVAGHLSPDQVCLSGSPQSIAALERALAERGTATRRVDIDYAAHHPQLDPHGPELLSALGAVHTRPAALPLWSTVTGDLIDGTALDARYWLRNLREPFRLAETVTALAARRPVRVVEVSPHPVLRHAVTRTLRDARAGALAEVAPTGDRRRPARQCLEDLAAGLWREGFDVDWDAVAGRPRRGASTTPVAVAVSGKTPAALAANAARLADRLYGASHADLRDVAHTAATRRSHLEHRAVAVAASSEDAVAGLRALAGAGGHPDLVEGRAGQAELAVLFTGQGAQRLGMGRGLYEAFPAFRAAFDQVCAAVDAHLRVPLVAVLFADPDGVDADLVHRTEFAQPALFAVEVALYRLWESWGVRPSVVAGHSVGEIAAAYAAGVLSLPHAARLVVARGRLMQGCEAGGAMASVEASEPEVLDVLAAVEGRVCVAGLNGPAQTVVSGDAAAVEAVREHFTALGRRTRRLEVSHAFHSPHMDAMLAEFGTVVRELDFAEPQLPAVSSVTGERVPAGEWSDPAYWIRQVREPVRFLDAVRALEAAGAGRYLEVGPGAVLSAMAANCVLDQESSAGRFTASLALRDGESEAHAVLRAVGALHAFGQPVDWDAVLPATGTLADLPTYAFQRERHWLDAPPRRPAGRGRDGADDALWQAVADGDAARFGELLGVRDGTAVQTLLPHLADWRVRRAEAADLADWTYEHTWQPVPAPRTAAPALDGLWLLVADPADRALTDTVAAALSEAGATPAVLAASDHRAGQAGALTDLVATLDGTAIAGVLALTPAEDTPHPEHPHTTTGAAAALALVQALGDASVRAPLWFVTRGAVWADAADPAPRPAQAALWGLGQVAALEHANRWGGLLDLPADPEQARAAAPQLAAALAERGSGEDQLALRPSGRHARRLRRTAPPAARPWTARGAVLVTGGSGALAGHLARRLAQRGAEHLVLVSRRGPDAEGAAELAAELQAAGARTTLAACDVTDREQLAALIARIDADGTPLRAVFHTAGTLDDRLLDGLDTAALAASAAPKQHAAELLHDLTRHHDLDAFVLYSSVVGVLGNTGQGNYAMANAALDALAARLRTDGVPALSVGWGPWADGGMAHGEAERRLRRTGLLPIAADRALTALEAALASGGHPVIAHIDWDRAAPAYTGGRDRSLLRDIAEARAGRDAPSSATTAAAASDPLRETLRGLPEPDRADHVRALLAVEAAAVLGVRDPGSLDPDRGFKDLGFDSMMAVDLAERVQRRTGVTTPRTLVYDCPDLHSATRWLLAELAPEAAESPTAVDRPASLDEPLAIVGVGLRMPGSAHDLDSLWQVLAEGRDTVRPVPADRFDLDAVYDPDPDAPGRSYVRHASLLDDVASFDAAFFGISPREAEPMDPQHRLLLEAAWCSLEDAGIRPRELRDSRTGVFVGAGDGEYGRHRRTAAPDTYDLTGALPSFNAGRLAYHLGLQGPALSVDTACSSSLVSLHLACESLRSGACDLALAGGVQVLADPGMFVALSRSHALAPDGRSKTFSAEADGYGRGEGVGVLAVMRLSDALAQDRTVLGVVRGTAVNHDGASSGITAPNGTSQQKVLREALGSAGLSAADVDYVECHGTGTSLGDPIEVQALGAVYGTDREPGRELGIGTAKSVIGHLESAAGIAGVCKVLASFRHGALPATRHSSPRNPAIAWDDLAVRVVDELTPWPRREGRPRRAGVSSFGLSGTNAHVVLEEAPPVRESAAATAEGPLPVVVSGQSEPALRAQAAAWADWLEGAPDAALVDIARTAAGHRTHFVHRAAVTAASVADAAAGLRALAEGVSHPELVQGEAGQSGKVVFVFPGQGPQWVAMGRELLAGSAVFGRVVGECDRVLAPLTGWSVRDVLAGVEGEGLPPVDRVDVVQPAL